MPEAERLGVAIEGSRDYWPAAEASARLSELSPYGSPCCPLCGGRSPPSPTTWVLPLRWACGSAYGADASVAAASTRAGLSIRPLWGASQANVAAMAG